MPPGTPWARLAPVTVALTRIARMIPRGIKAPGRSSVVLDVRPPGEIVRPNVNRSRRQKQHGADPEQRRMMDPSPVASRCRGFRRVPMMIFVQSRYLLVGRIRRDAGRPGIDIRTVLDNLASNHFYPDFFTEYAETEAGAQKRHRHGFGGLLPPSASCREHVPRIILALARGIPVAPLSLRQ
jgi:hypothetical protein